MERGKSLRDSIRTRENFYFTNLKSEKLYEFGNRNSKIGNQIFIFTKILLSIFNFFKENFIHSFFGN